MSAVTFIRAGRELKEPLAMGDAIHRAVHKRPSTDVDWVPGAEGESVKDMPWDTNEEAVAAVMHELLAAQALLKKLRAGELRSYVNDPVSNTCLMIGRHYWREQEQCDDYLLHSVPNAPGWQPSLEGQPILVAAEDLPQWAAVADAIPVASPLKPVAARASRKTKKMEEVEDFLKWARTNEHYREVCGDGLYDAYVQWTRKPGTKRRSALSRARFYELRAAWPGSA